MMDFPGFSHPYYDIINISTLCASHADYYVFNKPDYFIIIETNKLQDIIQQKMTGKIHIFYYQCLSNCNLYTDPDCSKLQKK